MAMKVWMRGARGALERAARRARRPRCAVRASPQIDAPRTSRATALHRLEVALARDREAGLDHVDAEPLELARDRELLVEVHAAARRLLAVAQRRVEDPDAVRSSLHPRGSGSCSGPSVAGDLLERHAGEAAPAATPPGPRARRRRRSRTASRRLRRSRAAARSPRARASRTSAAGRAPCRCGTGSGSP